MPNLSMRFQFIAPRVGVHYRTMLCASGQWSDRPLR